MRSTFMTLAAVTGLALTLPAAAQGQFSAEVRGSLNNPVGDFGDVADMGGGVGVDLIYNLTPRFSLYGGWSGAWFQCDLCEDGEEPRTSGFEGGVKLLFAREEGILPWLRVGVIANQLQQDVGPVEVTSDREVGFQLSGGVDIPLNHMFSLSPAVRYQAFDADFDVGTVSVQQVALDVGLHLHLSELGSR